ncbi:chromate transporter [Mobilisporobacter senegalensis]|uniref:Chromate transporter n=1 Tax=Mobilisporobacter senegalensis TaxID=1329262 RepID=A0A3N1XZ37_9FIRM|nr:chromate transporter [Mobilisporobacter senegalensis]ROR31854.1 chromate transporter [Mobilisporobacter senegalensis]
MKKNLLLLRVYLLAGAFTFSGGMAMLPVIERELCNKYGLIDKESLYEYTTLSQTFPGVIALTNACFVGKKINGTIGMIFAGIGAILPAYILMSIASLLYQLIPQQGPILSALVAVRATSASFLFAAAYTIAKYNLKTKINILLSFFCFAFTALNLIGAPILILLSALIGVCIVHIRKDRK